MNLKELARFASIKGLDIVGTGDFTQPDWRNEISRDLQEVADSGLYTLRDSALQVRYMLTGEVNTTFPFKEKSRRIHHCLLAPSIESAKAVSDRLAKYGNLLSDGRPTLHATAPELVDEVLEADSQCVIFPAHAWTPWFSLFGANSGFNSFTECYQDRSDRIFALETGMSCYDYQTEALTNRGWKKIHEIEYDDEICTLNTESESIEFQKPQGIFVYDYTGAMYKLKTQRVDLLVTPNHKLVYRPCDFRFQKALRLDEARILLGKSKRFKKDGTWRGRNSDSFLLPSTESRHGSRYYSGSRTIREKSFPIIPWLKFFGVWIAEGWVTKSMGEYSIYLSNRKMTLLTQLKHILRTFGYNPIIARDRNGYRLRVRDVQLFHYLQQLSGSSNKFVPDNIKDLSARLLRIFFEWYIKGDGRRYGRKGRGLSATTISLRLRDDLQEIALKLGISAYFKLQRKKGTLLSSLSREKQCRQSEDSWKVYFIRKNEPVVIPSTIKARGHLEGWVSYGGIVSCVSVPNKTLYVRRNGVPVWSGNSDPGMNWRLSQLDRLCLISNSDAHSAWPWRLGREANVFDPEHLTYQNLVSAIRDKDPKRFLFTIETSPAYGKYHWTGHRECSVSMSAKDAQQLDDKCPKCGKKMTRGVEERIEELADRPEGYMPKNAIGYRHLLPLSEIIAVVIGEVNPGSTKVWDKYNLLVGKFRSEYSVMLDVPEDQLLPVAGPEISSAILRVRNDNVFVEPGYDGVYGKLDLKKPPPVKKSHALGLEQFV
jgi:PHP family Zn ribbon phosphoesterase